MNRGGRSERGGKVGEPRRRYERDGTRKLKLLTYSLLYQ
jgi:hypothetical protein